MNSKTHASVLAALLALSALGLSATAQIASEPAHSHGAAVHELKLDHGRKWGTDDALRQGMTGIRNAVESRLADVHRGRLTPAQYDALGGEIDAQVAHIVQNCKLDPEADAQLHVLLEQVMHGNEVLRGKDVKQPRTEGVVAIVAALADYGEYFDHPGWRAPKAAH